MSDIIETVSIDGGHRPFFEHKAAFLTRVVENRGPGAIQMRFLLIFAVLLPMPAACSRDQGTRDEKAPLVTVEPVRNAAFVARIDAVGTARANEQVTIAAPVTERIVRLNFDDGSYVSKGAVIAVLAQGQESAALADAQARETEAHQQLERLIALKHRGFATTSAVDAQTALAASARARADEVRAQIGDRIIRAPFGGWVSLRTISAGAVVSAGTEIATISDLSRIKLDFTVPETLLSAIAPGQPILAESAAWPDQPFRGSIETVDPVLDPTTRAATARAILPNGDRKLKPGMLMTVTIESASRTAPAVPELAVVGDGDRSFVYALGKDGSVKRTLVTTGLHQHGRVEITSGIKPGQRIVTEGVVKLADGMKVRVAPPTGATLAERE